MAILETVGMFILSLFCLGNCFEMQRKYRNIEIQINNIEQIPPRYDENLPEYEETEEINDPAPSYEETTPILQQPTDQHQH